MPIVFYQIGEQLDSWEHGHDLLSLRLLKKEVFGDTITRSDLCRIGTTMGDINLVDNDAEIPQTSALSRVIFGDSRSVTSKRAREVSGGDEAADGSAEGEKKLIYKVMDWDMVGHSSRVKGRLSSYCTLSSPTVVLLFTFFFKSIMFSNW